MNAPESASARASLPPRIAVLILTRGRPAGLVAAVQALHATATGALPIQYVLCCDDDDPTIAQSAALLEHLPVLISRNPRPDALGGAWNLGAEAADPWDMALFTGDDTVPVTQHWDARMAEHFVAGRAAWAWTEANDPGNCTYWVTTRRWHDAVGQACPEFFPYWFNDTWVAEQHLFAFAAPIHVDPALIMGGRRGTTREMRELAFWFRVFAATRVNRMGEAVRIARAFGHRPPDPTPMLEWCNRWDAAQQASVPAYNAAFGADQVPPTPRYRRLRAHAETLLPRPAFDLDAAARRERNPLPHVPFMMQGPARLPHLQGHALPPVCETEGVSQ